MYTLFIVGSRGSGKTSLCARIVDGARARHMGCCGCLERSIRDASGLPYRIEIEDIASGASFLAARRTPDTQTPFEFYSEAFSRARELCVAAIHAQDRHSAGWPAGTARRICCIDEIGPLELTDMGGHRELLERILRDKPIDVLMLTVRPSLRRELEALLMSRGIDKSEVEVIDTSISNANGSLIAVDSILNAAPD